MSKPTQLPRAARLMIVDDHELARSGLRAMLAREPGIEVVHEASNGQEAMDCCETMRPDLILMDVRMPHVNGLTATAAIKERFPNISVIIVTMYENPDYLFQAIRAGAAGYILKDATREEVVFVVHQVLDGETILNPELAAQVLRRLSRETPSPHGRMVEQLTRREAEVLHLLAQGMTNREIGNVLNISVGTVKVHVEHIISKLGVSDRTQAAVRAMELGLLRSAVPDR
jgi:DNA-binding NarL/FixJ family response regulator